MVLLTVLWVKTCQGAYGSHEHYQLGSGAALWHMDDLLWIVLFPLAYVMRRKVSAIFNSSFNQIWLALLAASVTYRLGESGASGLLGRVPVRVMLTKLLAKGLWVIDHLTELRHAPRLSRWRARFRYFPDCAGLPNRANLSPNCDPGGRAPPA